MRPVDPPIESVAALAQRLAVLLAAGVAPHTAWTYLDEAGADAAGANGADTAGTAAARGRWHPRRLPLWNGRDDPARVAELNALALRAASRAAARGGNIAEALRDAVTGEASHAAPVTPSGRRAAAAWLALAAAWAVAGEAGAPLAATLRGLAATFRDQARLERDLAAALAGPRATARLVGAMPVIGVLFGALLGFDTVGTLFGTVPGLICLALGGALTLAGAGWSRALVRRAAGAHDDGLMLELTSIAMSGGMSTERARALAEGAARRFMIQNAAGTRAIDGVLALSRRAGVPAVELLRSEATQARLRSRSAGEQRAAGLAVTLMIPLGLCVLPAFMLVGVLPLLIAVLSSTLGTF
ncbi:tight adherence protein B [Microterricola gilva]|uniref:Tight adherence protein B n=1 Tax=Microterricola gilva TaxID=393267 RepID=A0A4Q8ANZ8_9MICO|nr:type II secretion system F family protein [Microterricola gilva]RZU66288.1 tight adherence protein B [Microterricola gilva]